MRTLLTFVCSIAIFVSAVRADVPQRLHPLTNWQTLDAFPKLALRYTKEPNWLPTLAIGKLEKAVVLGWGGYEVVTAVQWFSDDSGASVWWLRLVSVSRDHRHFAVLYTDEADAAICQPGPTRTSKDRRRLLVYTLFNGTGGFTFLSDIHFVHKGQIKMQSKKANYWDL